VGFTAVEPTWNRANFTVEVAIVKLTKNVVSVEELEDAFFESPKRYYLIETGILEYVRRYLQIGEMDADNENSYSPGPTALLKSRHALNFNKMGLYDREGKGHKKRKGSFVGSKLSYTTMAGHTKMETRRPSLTP